ncbi:hypothetical protein MXD63_16665 [Frankia sp. Cpl3]|nr:hypothetical protein [Parafrankia colletiae]MCK9901702.1 hypothetical protein [Frankia sp. Cpl3]
MEHASAGHSRSTRFDTTRFDTGCSRADRPTAGTLATGAEFAREIRHEI